MLIVDKQLLVKIVKIQDSGLPGDEGGGAMVAEGTFAGGRLTGDKGAFVGEAGNFDWKLIRLGGGAINLIAVYILLLVDLLHESKSII